MGNIVLVEGENQLNVQMVRLPPDIQFLDFYWDGAPPFQAPSQHKFSAIFKNLRPFDFWFQVESYVNGELFNTKNVGALGGQSSVVNEWFTFSTAGIYTITVKAFYNNLLLDEISSTVTVRPPPPVVVVDGQFRQFHVRWEDEIYWYGLGGVNNWPADKQMIIMASILNTGDVTATFSITGRSASGAVSLVPGEYDIIAIPPFYAVDGTYTWKLYAKGKKVDELTFEVITY